jgi:hypothetical protein
MFIHLDLPKQEQIEKRMLEEVLETHKRYEAGECDAEEFTRILKRFSDFISGPTPANLDDTVTED